MTIAKKYENINWKQCYVTLFTLQNEILEAFRSGDTANVRKAQHALLPRALAVRKVTTNKGKNTPRVDKTLLRTNKEKFEAIHSVKISLLTKLNQFVEYTYPKLMANFVP